ncbi:MAG: ABC transporter permease [Ardenticatenaceae bacterium]|nr:ABC transporter permease [Ardenticatenaceae bacterium]
MIREQHHELVLSPLPVPSGPGALFAATGTLWRKHMAKFLRNREELGGTVLQPILWVLLFGIGMGHLLRSGTVPLAEIGTNYMAFILPGIVALSALGGAVGGGMTLLEERLKGTMKEYLVAPIPRLSILLSNELSTTTKALFQALVIVVLGTLAGARPTGQPLAWLGAALLVAGFAFGFSSLAVAFGARSKSIMGYHGLIALFNLPLLFASNALYPLGVLPGWLRVVVLLNPTTYAVDGLRRLLYRAPAVLPLGLVFAVTGGFALLCVWLALASFQGSLKQV